MKAATGEEVSAEDLGGADVHTRLSGSPTTSPRTTCTPWPSPVASWRTCPPCRTRRGRCSRARAAHDPHDLYGIIPPDLRSRLTSARSSRGSSTAANSTSSKPATGRRWSPGSRTSWVPGGYRRQQRHFVQRKHSEGRPLYRAVFPAPVPAGVPAEHHRVHGRARVREPRVGARRGQDGHGGGERSGAQVHGDRRQQLRRGQLRHVRPGYAPRQLWMWPNARISVMGGQQAASVLLQVRLDNLHAKAATVARQRAAFTAPILESYEPEGRPYFSTARLWDDGVIDPLDTRMVLAPRPVRRAQCADPGHAVRRLPDVAVRGQVFRPSCRQPGRDRPAGHSHLPAPRGAHHRRLFRRRRAAPHVRAADEAVGSGRARGRSYLRVDVVIGAAGRPAPRRSTLATASSAENAAFADAATDAGLAWIGPPPAAMRALGDKARAKALAERSACPSAGYHGEDAPTRPARRTPARSASRCWSRRAPAAAAAGCASSRAAGA